MHQPDHAGRAAHVALHVFHAGGALDGDTAGIEANAFANKSNGLIALLAAVPAHDHGAAGLRRALRNTEQGAHAELLHRLDVEHLDLDAELLELAGAAREFHGIENVRRLVDEFARDHHAVHDMGCRREGLARGGDIPDGDRNIGTKRAVLALFLLGLVAIEFIRAQPDARRDGGGGIVLHRGLRQFGDHGDRFAGAVELARRHPSEFEKILFLDLGRLADTDHDQALRLDSVRRRDIERRSALALELVGGRRPLDGVGRRPQRLPRRLAKLQCVIAKHHENATGSGGKSDKADLDGVGHG